MMNATSYHLLLDPGRKAGLTSRELNSALSTCPVRGAEQPAGHSDANGFISGIDVRGQRVSRPVVHSPHS